MSKPISDFDETCFRFLEEDLLSSLTRLDHHLSKIKENAEDHSPFLGYAEQAAQSLDRTVTLLKQALGAND